MELPFFGFVTRKPVEVHTFVHAFGIVYITGKMLRYNFLVIQMNYTKLRGKCLSK